MSDHDFAVEAPTDGDPIPAAIFTDPHLSGRARSILMAVHGRPRSVSRPSLTWLCATLELSRAAWLKTARELVHAGWLIRRNHGGMGQGRGFRHERTFLRAPRENPLLASAQASAQASVQAKPKQLLKQNSSKTQAIAQAIA